jgi:hypothetical protein
MCLCATSVFAGPGLAKTPCSIVGPHQIARTILEMLLGLCSSHRDVSLHDFDVATLCECYLHEFRTPLHVLSALF